eukprot:2864689-Pyramimonas_sp.AAC.1
MLVHGLVIRAQVRRLAIAGKCAALQSRKLKAEHLAVILCVNSQPSGAEDVDAASDLSERWAGA